MSKLITIDLKKIVEIRNAITVISLTAYNCNINSSQDVIARIKIIQNQVKKVDKLLPQIKFEEEK